jgi:hypothetical protein
MGGWSAWVGGRWEVGSSFHNQTNQLGGRAEHAMYCTADGLYGAGCRTAAGTPASSCGAPPNVLP